MLSGRPISIMGTSSNNIDEIQLTLSVKMTTTLSQCVNNSPIQDCADLGDHIPLTYSILYYNNFVAGKRTLGE